MKMARLMYIAMTANEELIVSGCLVNNQHDGLKQVLSKFEILLRLDILPGSSQTVKRQ